MKIDFEITHGGYTLSDALHLPDDHTFTAEEIEQMKLDRFRAWYANLNAPKLVLE